MEFLPIIEGLIYGCGCLLDIMAASSGVGAGVAGVQANQQRKNRKAAKERGETPPRNTATPWFVLLLIAAILTGTLVLFKYLGTPNPPAGR